MDNTCHSLAFVQAYFIVENDSFYNFPLDATGNFNSFKFPKRGIETQIKFTNK